MRRGDQLNKGVDVPPGRLPAAAADYACEVAARTLQPGPVHNERARSGLDRGRRAGEIEALDAHDLDWISTEALLAFDCARKLQDPPIVPALSVNCISTVPRSVLAMTATSQAKGALVSSSMVMPDFGLQYPAIASVLRKERNQPAAWSQEPPTRSNALHSLALRRELNVGDSGSRVAILPLGRDVLGNPELIALVLVYVVRAQGRVVTN